MIRRITKPYEGQKDFDKDYIDIQIVDKIVPIDVDKNEFVVEKVVVESKRDIVKTIQADADSVGVNAVIRDILRTGDMSLLPVDKGNVDVDYTNAPSNLMEIKEMGVDASKKFKSLPEELTQGMDMISFVNSMSQDKFDTFCKAMAERASKKGDFANEQK